MLKSFLIKQASSLLTDIQDINSIIYEVYYTLTHNEILTNMIYDINANDDMKRYDTSMIKFSNKIIHSIEYSDYLPTIQCIGCEMYHCITFMMRVYLSYDTLTTINGNVQNVKFTNVPIRICSTCIFAYYKKY
jgi:hypothetical protein